MCKKDQQNFPEYYMYIIIFILVLVHILLGCVHSFITF